MVHLVASLFQAGVLFLFGFVIEAMLLADEKNTARNMAFNCWCALLYYVGAATIGTLITLKLASLVQLFRFHGIIDLSRLNANGNWLVAIALSFLWIAIRDFFYYWMHRLQHHSRWLWAEHELHHSEEHMNVTTASRHHWLETTLESIFVTTPLLILFRPPVITAVAAYILSVSYGSFIHLNARISLGPLNCIFANPSTHRIHHSREAAHLDKNFAAFFPVWDVIFGTYCAPPQDRIPETGLASGSRVHSFSEAFLLPFQNWTRLIRKSVPDEGSRKPSPSAVT